jgi:hypothetical protein
MIELDFIDNGIVWCEPGKLPQTAKTILADACQFLGQTVLAQKVRDQAGSANGVPAQGSHLLDSSFANKDGKRALSAEKALIIRRGSATTIIAHKVVFDNG